jgi:ATP-dependent HslUV protease subunit HslV
MASLRAVLPLLPSAAGRTCAAASVAACSGASSSHSAAARLFPSPSSSAHASPRRSYHAPPYGHAGYPGSPVAGAGPAPHEPAGPLHGHGLGWAPTGSALPPSAYAMSTHATTILAVRKGGKVVSAAGLRRPRAAARAGRDRQRDGKWRQSAPTHAPHDPIPPPSLPPPSQAVIGDGQVTRGSEIVKGNAVKVRRIGSGGVISGFAGSTADCLALRERLETKLEEHPGQLTRACVELAKEWRTEKYLRNLAAVMLVVDKDVSLTITGNGDVMEPADGIIAIGSGGSYALAAARALVDTDLTAMQIAEKSMKIAAEMCVYTNTNFVRDEM